MRYFSTITLFSERPELNQQPYSFAASVLVHGAAMGLLALGILSAPKVKTPSTDKQYAVRHLDLHTLEPLMQRSSQSSIDYPRLHPIAHQHSPGGRAKAHLPVLRQIAKASPAPQTLLQPDLPKPLTLTEKIPVPTFVIWDGKNTPARTLIAPMPEKPAVADVQPSIQPPNEAQNLADHSIAASELAAHNQPILPSATSPVVMRGPEPTPPQPVTTAEGAAHSTPAAVISLSDLRMANGAVMLPPVNETASSDASGALAPGQAARETDARKGSGDAGSSSDSAGDQSSVTHITVPENGQFGAVVVGSSMEDKYPETAGLWSGRLGYTVYLHVGLAKSWILQYSLPRAADAAEAGDIASIKAPWPYNIVVPNIAPGTINADALMVHGFVNQAGRFESLSIAFPPQFAQAKFVLNTLSQWQFRPATQNGKAVKVEVLLIIPNDQE
jgi:hypothetical protein